MDIYQHIEIERNKAKQLKRTQWWKSQKGMGKCHYCQERFDPKILTMDHKVPISRGGKSTKKNLVPCCQECNQKKKYLTSEEWAAHIKQD